MDRIDIQKVGDQDHFKASTCLELCTKTGTVWLKISN